jgi:hypothetical protein
MTEGGTDCKHGIALDHFHGLSLIHSSKRFHGISGGRSELFSHALLVLLRNLLFALASLLFMRFYAVLCGFLMRGGDHECFCVEY